MSLSEKNPFAPKELAGSPSPTLAPNLVSKYMPKGFKLLATSLVPVERSPNNADPKTGAPLFSRVIAVRPNLFGGKELPKPTTGGGQQGGQSGGGMGMPGMGGGMMGGGMGMNPMMGGGMGGGMGGMGFRYRHGSGIQQTVPQASQHRYRSFNFRRR